MDIFIQIFIGVAVTILGAIILEFRNEWKKEQLELKTKNEYLEKALVEVLGWVIDELFEVHIKLGYIGVEKLKKIVNLCDLYTKLGGNHGRQTEVDKLKELPNIPQEDN